MAASKGAVKIDGVREVQRAMSKVGAEAADLKVAHMRVSSLLIPGITARTPRRSGNLAAGWKPGATKGRARITNSERYAGVIEYGWPEHNIEPARMIRDEVGASHREILEAYEQELARLAASAGFDVKT